MFEFDCNAIPNDWLMNHMSEELLEDCICTANDETKALARARWREVSQWAKYAVPVLEDEA